MSNSEEQFDPRALRLPDDWWTQPNVVQPLSGLFARHIVYLHVVYRHPGTKTMQAVLTGFLVTYKEWAFWVTAGHVIDQLQALLSSPGVQIGGADFIDGHPNSAPPIRLDLQNMPMDSIDRKGMDVGFIALRKYYVRNLMANENLRWMSSSCWAPPTDIEPEIHALVGAPTNWNEFHEVPITATETHCQANTPLVCAAVCKIEDRGNDGSLQPFWGYREAFYGVVGEVNDDQGRSLDDIDGMSGGPVFALFRFQDGHSEYRLVGIQSAWQKTPRTVRATPALVLQLFLDHWLSQLSMAA